MVFYCDITEDACGLFAARFPDLGNVVAYGSSREKALGLARKLLEEMLSVNLDYTLEMPEPRYSGGFPVEVPPRLAFALELRKARANLNQREVAKAAGISWRQYERLENPVKANPSFEVLCRLQRVLGHRFLVL